jgi:hypothetical protein
MKLIIRRDQKAQTGLLGGHKGMTFLLTTRVELTPQEQELVKRYKAEDYALTEATLVGTKVIPGVTVTNLMHGVTKEAKQIGTLVKTEEEIKDNCKALKELLAFMATFGGEEVIEF